VSFWDRFRKKPAEEAPKLEPRPPARPEPARTEAERVAAARAERADAIESFAARIGVEGGPRIEEILEWIRERRGTADEGTLVRALAEAGPRAPEPVRVATAELLAARGDEERALQVLEGAATASALLLAADLHASRGALARAVTSIERVLAKEIDAPGARERHTRWRASLGGSTQKVGRTDEATVVGDGQREAPFRVLREVARGGAGTVYEAEDEALGRKLAFKVYHGRGADRAAIEREVRSMVDVAGTGVARILDASPEDGWVALEWVATGSVRDVLRRGDAARLAAVRRLAEPLAVVLARLHRRGLVHGDVKPANVLLRAADAPVLTDFGLARAPGHPTTGGSPGYVSPERLDGAPVDPRDDVYGFGRVLEDLLDAVGTNDLRTLAEACLLPAERRLPDGLALVAWLRSP
jgi:hypothetical protein